MKKILIIGYIENEHLKKFTHYLNSEKDFIIDICTNVPSSVNYNQLDIYKNLYRQIFQTKRNFPSILYKLFFIRTILFSLDLLILLKNINKKEKYDVVNVSFVIHTLYFSRKYLKKIGKNVILTPWGSDVYRVSGLKKFLLKKIYSHADYVTFISNRFKSDIQRTFNVSEHKFIDLGFGSEIIDKLIHSNETRESAKQKLGFDHNYLISCGYNASPSQYHESIIEELIKIKDKLPSNYLLIFQMTYPKNIEYKEYIKNLLEENHLNYYMFTDYLDDYSLMNLRKATDIFIHVQKSDAYSASIQEYLLCNTKVINASWVRYPDLEKYGIPYYIMNDFNDLAETLLYAISDEEPMLSKPLLKVIQKKGWEYNIQNWRSFIKQL